LIRHQALFYKPINDGQGFDTSTCHILDAIPQLGAPVTQVEFQHRANLDDPISFDEAAKLLTNSPPFTQVTTTCIVSAVATDDPDQVISYGCPGGGKSTDKCNNPFDDKNYERSITTFLLFTSTSEINPNPDGIS
jgi:hypothetical protein